MYVMIFFACEMIVSLPTLLFESKVQHVGDGDIVYKSSIVWMLREKSFDEEKNKDDLEIIDNVMDVDIIEKFVEEQGDNIYNALSWVYGDNSYYAMRQNIDGATMEQFKKAVIRIAYKQPVCFLKSRIRAFYVGSKGYTGTGLLIPLLLTCYIGLTGIKTNRHLLVIFALGTLVQTALTTLFMPIFKFKYYYEMYLFGYVFVWFAVGETVQKKLRKDAFL